MPAQPLTFKPVSGTKSYAYYADMETVQRGLMTVQATRRLPEVRMDYMRDGQSSGWRMSPAEARALAASLLAAADAAEPPLAALHQDELAYALNRHLPNMEHGFAIQTSYGDFSIPPGWMADRVIEHVRHQVEIQLLPADGVVA